MPVGFPNAIAPVARRLPAAGPGALLGTKTLDAATTWYALRHVPAAYERNPIAARAFTALGVEAGLLLLSLCTVLGVVAAVESGAHLLRTRTTAPGEVRRILVSVGYVGPSVLFAAIALYNCRVLY
jgi:hypothetical protein